MDIQQNMIKAELPWLQRNDLTRLDLADISQLHLVKTGSRRSWLD